mmetsp:Transcript_2687/g.1891  ORF Transcript_2687/g.1891 Transcript_2687/m.1891 type:complete len:95 (+) Transcript_2687:301-585(+)
MMGLCWISGKVAALEDGNGFFCNLLRLECVWKVLSFRLLSRLVSIYVWTLTIFKEGFLFKMVYSCMRKYSLALIILKEAGRKGRIVRIELIACT